MPKDFVSKGILRGLLMGLHNRCRNLSFGLVTKARVYKGAGQEGSQESHLMLPGMQKSVRE